MEIVNIKPRGYICIKKETLPFGVYKFNFELLSKGDTHPLIILSVLCKKSNFVLFAEKIDLSSKKLQAFQFCVPKDSMDIEVNIENPTEFSRKIPNVTIKYEPIKFERVETFCSVSGTYDIVASYNKTHKSYITDTLECMDPFIFKLNLKDTGADISSISVFKDTDSSNPIFKISSHTEQYINGLPLYLTEPAKLHITCERVNPQTKELQVNVTKYNFKKATDNLVENADIGVIIPMFNTGTYISKTIDSLIDQTVRPRAIYVVDDCSDFVDIETLEQLKSKCLSENICFYYFMFKANVGPYICKNFILSKFEGFHRYWTFLDSDDYYTPNKLECQIERLSKDPNSVGCYTFYNRISLSGELVKNRGLDARLCYASLMIKSEVIEKIGYFDAVRFGADEDFHNRLIAHFGKESLQHIENPLYKALVRKSSLSNQESPIKLDTKTKSSGQDQFLSPVRYEYAKFSKERSQKESKRLKFDIFKAKSQIHIQEMASLPNIYIHFATFPPRFEIAKKTLKKLIEECPSIFTEVHLCINEVEDIPDTFKEFESLNNIYLHIPKFDLKDNGKFMRVQEGINFWIDDDFALNYDYFKKTISEALQRETNTLFSYHGWSGSSYTDREVCHFKAQMSIARNEDVLGTGLSCMWITRPAICEVLNAISENRLTGMVDLLVARACVFLGVSKIVLPRVDGFVCPVESDSKSSLFSHNSNKERVSQINRILTQVSDMKSEYEKGSSL